MSIWNIVEYKPKVPQAQGNLRSAYTYEKDRKLPDLQAGFRIFGSDQDPNPANSFLYVENPVRLPQIDPFAWGPQYESILQVKEDHNQGFRATLDIPDLRRIPVSVNGVPLEGFQPPPQQEVQAETRTNHASGAGEAHKVAVTEKNNRTKYDAEEKKKDAEPVKLEEDEPVKPEETGQYVPMDTTEQNVKPEKGGFWSWFTGLFSGGKISEPNQEKLYDGLSNMVKDIMQKEFPNLATKEDVERIITVLKPFIKDVGDATIKVEGSESKNDVDRIMDQIDDESEEFLKLGVLTTKKRQGEKKELKEMIDQLNFSAKKQDSASIQGSIDRITKFLNQHKREYPNSTRYDDIKDALLQVRISLLNRDVNNPINLTESVLSDQVLEVKRLVTELGVMIYKGDYARRLERIEESLLNQRFSTQLDVIQNEANFQDLQRDIQSLGQKLVKNVQPASSSVGTEAVVGQNIFNPADIELLGKTLPDLITKIRDASQNFTNLGNAFEKNLYSVATEYGKYADEKLDNVIKALQKQELEYLNRNEMMLNYYYEKFRQLLPNSDSQNPQAQAGQADQINQLNQQLESALAEIEILKGRLLPQQEQVPSGQVAPPALNLLDITVKDEKKNVDLMDLSSTIERRKLDDNEDENNRKKSRIYEDEDDQYDPSKDPYSAIDLSGLTKPTFKSPQTVAEILSILTNLDNENIEDFDDEKIKDFVKVEDEIDENIAERLRKSGFISQEEATTSIDQNNTKKSRRDSFNPSMKMYDFGIQTPLEERLGVVLNDRERAVLKNEIAQHVENPQDRYNQGQVVFVNSETEVKDPGAELNEILRKEREERELQNRQIEEGGLTMDEMKQITDKNIAVANRRITILRQTKDRTNYISETNLRPYIKQWIIRKYALGQTQISEAQMNLTVDDTLRLLQGKIKYSNFVTKKSKHYFESDITRELRAGPFHESKRFNNPYSRLLDRINDEKSGVQRVDAGTYQSAPTPPPPVVAPPPPPPAPAGFQGIGIIPPNLQAAIRQGRQLRPVGDRTLKPQNPSVEDVLKKIIADKRKFIRSRKGSNDDWDEDDKGNSS
jgi:hypothetical protein